MDDTISRRGTIVALKSGLLDEDGVHVWRDVRNTTINAAIEVVEAMPSAQPGWIPCKERLPKPEEEVLLTFDYKKRRYVETGNIWSDGTAHCYADDYLTPDGRKYRKVVAWMPLPKPWKGDKHEAE